MQTSLRLALASTLLTFSTGWAPHGGTGSLKSAEVRSPVSIGSATPDPPLPPETFTGQALTGFSQTSYASAPGNAVDFRPGMTLWITLRLRQPCTSTYSIAATTTPALTKGWLLFSQGCQILLYTAGGSIPTFKPPTNDGILSLAYVWDAATTAMSVAVNGGPLTNLGNVAPAPVCDGTCTSYLGQGYLGVGPYPGTNTDLLSLASWSSEATAAQASAGTFTQGNRYVLPSSVTAPAVVDLEFSRGDWAGTSATFTSQGSAPVTWTQHGTGLSLRALSETRYPALSSYYNDGKFELAQSYNGYSWTARNPYAHLRAQTDAASVAVEAVSSTVWYGYPNVFAYVDGNFAQSWPLQAGTDLGSGNMVPGAPAMAAFGVGTGTTKTIDLWEGSGDTNDYIIQPYGRWGSYIQAIRLPNLLEDGVTPAHSSMLPALSPPAHRVVLVMDHGADWVLSAGTQSQASVPGLLRAAYPYPADGVTMHGGFSLAMANMATLGDRGASIVPELDGTVTNAVWINLGEIDYHVPNVSVPLYASTYQSLVDRICTGKPGTAVWMQSPSQTLAPDNEAIPNGFGATLADYRAVIKSIASLTCPDQCTCHYVECAAGACVSNANSSSDGLNATGIWQLANVIESHLTAANSCGATSCL